jgi:hypothetical protein
MQRLNLSMTEGIKLDGIRHSPDQSASARRKEEKGVADRGAGAGGRPANGRQVEGG